MTSVRVWAIALAALPLFQNAANAKLTIGDAAPPLKIAEWIKGDPVELSEGAGKTIFVVEFWATWCAPCRETIPHLTKLQQAYNDKNVVIVAVSNEPVTDIQPRSCGNGVSGWVTPLRPIATRRPAWRTWRPPV
jgi:thiol-disulfide isomerase/thioredoxin